MSDTDRLEELVAELTADMRLLEATVVCIAKNTGVPLSVLIRSREEAAEGLEMLDNCKGDVGEAISEMLAEEAMNEKQEGVCEH